MSIPDRFRPLPEVIFYDDFDTGLNGWISLNPNFRQDRMEYYPALERLMHWGPPMLSTATFGYAGTHGSLSGTYSMKLATRPVAGKATEQPVAGSMGHAIKRLTFRSKQLLKCEMWYAFTAEQDRPGIGESDMRAFGFFWDVQDDEYRAFYGARYVNAADGKMQQRWQLLKAAEGRPEDWGDQGQSAPGENPEQESGSNRVFLSRGIDPQWHGLRYANGSSDAFYDIPDSGQKLCYNETVDKINWHYMALTIDLARREYVELESVGRTFDLRGVQPTLVKRFPRIDWLLNPVVWVEADTDRRVFLYVDSIVNSTGRGERS
jgi:hypothetical protein